MICFAASSTDPATIKDVTSSVSKSWIGQTVTLTCKSDGVPTPTLTWYKPDGTKFNQVKAKENQAVVPPQSDRDFGLYNCTADNGFAPVLMTVFLYQIKAPGPPTITSTEADIQATSLTVKWTEPTDIGGSPITAYRVVVLQGVAEIKNDNITNPAFRSWPVGDLEKNTNYTVKVFARNYVFEGNAVETTFQTKFEGIPASAEITDLPADTKAGEIIIKWNTPKDNGAPITKYTVYQRIVSDGGTPKNWITLHVITDVSNRTATVKLVKGKKYEFVVTATNRHGESIKEEEKLKRITVGDVPEEVVITVEVNYYEIKLQWEEPENNGAAITQYDVYQRIVNDKTWTNIGTMKNTSKREFVVEEKDDKQYKFAVTATNKYGESSKEASIKRVKGPEVSTTPTESRTGSSCSDEKTTLHAVYMTVILLLLISNLVLIYLLWRMRYRSENSGRSKKCPTCGDLIAMNPILKTVQVEADTQPLSVAQMGDAPAYATPVGADYMPLNPSTKSWEISREKVNIIKVIGKGAFSKVAQATVRNIRGSQENTTVAVKMLKANAPASDRKDLLSELELMKKLKPHPHVIKLMGCVTESDPLLVLIEYVPYGDLLGYLRKSRGLNDTYFKDPDVKPQSSLTAEQLMTFACHVADGMLYLSSKKIIHRDLAARNVLVGEGEKCKVTDFGMARNVQQDDIYNRTSRGRLPVKWTAYEALMYGTYTTQSDVWSFGILLYEILTVGGSPYPDINPREIARKLQEGYRMLKPRHVEDKLYQIMLRCWEENPVHRPTFDKLRKTMKEIERNHKTYVNLNQYDPSLYANVKDLTAE